VIRAKGQWNGRRSSWSGAIEKTELCRSRLDSCCWGEAHWHFCYGQQKCHFVTLTIENHSGAAFGSCMDNSACELTPTVNPSSVTLSSAPFPITITPNSVVALRFDLDVNSSILSGLSSINPTITITNVIQRGESEGSKEVGEVDEVDGQVTSIGNHQFTLMNEQSGQSFNITVDTNTVFQDFNRAGCTVTPADFTCVKVGQILDVDLSATGMGMTLAKRVEFEEDASHQALKGVITSVDCGKPQFQMVVFNEEPTMAGISEGSPIVVMIPNAVFQAAQEEMGEDGGFSSSNLSFAGCKDLLVGQDVQIRPGTASTSGGITRVTTDLVRLWPSQITGTVGSVDTSNGTFTLTGFSPLFTFAMPAAVTTITVETVSGMLVLDGSGSGLPTVGTVSVKGLLFNTFSTLGMPTLVTRTMREHHDD